MDVRQDMVDAFTQARDGLLGIEGVNGVDIGLAEDATGASTGDLAIRVRVDDVTNPPPGIPADVGGFPVVHVARGIAELDVEDLARYDPVQGGCSVSNVDRPQPTSTPGAMTLKTGTLGAIARDAATGALTGLSNYHVLCPPGFAIGDQIEQPQGSSVGRAQVNRLGSLLRCSTFAPGLFSPMPVGMTDAAICTIERSAAAAVADIGPVISMGTARPQDPVRKRGKVTRMTSGMVTAILVAQRSELNGGTWMLGQIEIRPDPASPAWSAEGDSGSIVVDANGAAVGLHWGRDPFTGFGVASDIWSVCAELGITLAWPIPQVSSVDPPEGSEQGGYTVAITGTGFQLASDVTFGGVSCPVFNRLPSSDTEIVATAPPGTGAVDVLVIAPGGSSGAGLGPTFRYT